MKKLLTLISLASLLTLSSSPALALNFIVNNTADVPDANPGDGICNPLNALPGTCTLRAAVMEANANPGEHQILVATGTYTLSNTGAGEDAAVTGDLDILRTIRIFNGTDNRPVINGAYADRVFDIHPTGRLVLENIDVAAGSANMPGTTNGGAFNVRANINDEGSLVLSRSNVSANIANIGGAIYSDGSVLVTESEFFFNAITDEHVAPQFADGAAILSRGDLWVSTSTFRSNGALPGGEGDFLENEYAVHARRGFNEDAAVSVRITLSTFYDNTNGIFIDGKKTRLEFLTIVNNNQRGLRFLRNIDRLGELQLWVDNTVIYGHTGDCNGLPTADPEFDVAFNVNASSDETCGFTGFNSFQNIEMPFRDEPGDFGGLTTTFMPLPDSVLIDPVGTGNVCFLFSADQRGQPRPIDGNDDGVALCDIGSVEFNPETDAPVPIVDKIFRDRFEQS